MDPFSITALLSLAIATLVGMRQTPESPREFGVTDAELVELVRSGCDPLGGMDIGMAALNDPRRVIELMSLIIREHMTAVVPMSPDEAALEAALAIESYNFVRERSGGKLPVPMLAAFQASFWRDYWDQVQLGEVAQRRMLQGIQTVDEGFARAAEVADAAAHLVAPQRPHEARAWRDVARATRGASEALGAKLTALPGPWGIPRQLPEDLDMG